VDAQLAAFFHSSSSSRGWSQTAAAILPSVSNSGFARPFSIPLIIFSGTRRHRPPTESPLASHGFKETKASIGNKLARRTVPAALFLATLVAIGAEVVKLKDI